MEWMVRNLYTKSHLLSECLTCISALPLQREHKLNLRRCLVSFRDEMTTKERLTVIHCLFSIIESKQEYSLCDLLFSLLFSVSFQDLAPSIVFMTSIFQKKRCLVHPLLSLLVLLDALMDTFSFSSLSHRNRRCPAANPPSVFSSVTTPSHPRSSPRRCIPLHSKHPCFFTACCNTARVFQTTTSTGVSSSRGTHNNSSAF